MGLLLAGGAKWVFYWLEVLSRTELFHLEGNSEQKKLGLLISRPECKCTCVDLSSWNTPVTFWGHKMVLKKGYGPPSQRCSSHTSNMMLQKGYCSSEAVSSSIQWDTQQSLSLREDQGACCLVWPYQPRSNIRRKDSRGIKVRGEMSWAWLC